MTIIRVHQGRFEDQRPPVIIDGPNVSGVQIHGASTIVWRPDQSDSEIEIQE